MSNAEIRVTEGDLNVFKAIFLSLESHQPPKSEKDILKSVAERFGLPPETGKWPDILVSQGVSREAVLDFVLEQLQPFVEMMLELYRFLSKMVSTAGGRTTHFEINTDDMKYRLDFPDVDFPRKVQWIESWARIHTRMVEVDFIRISRLISNDNGIFYGRVNDIRFLQSLVIARQEGGLSPQTQTLADRIYQTMLGAVRAWWAGYRERPEADRFIATALVPGLHNQLNDEGRMSHSTTGQGGGDVGIDLDVILRVGGGSYSDYDAFTDGSIANVEIPVNDRHAISSALFFVAVWGLNDSSFQKVTGVLTTHNDDPNILRGSQFESRAQELGKKVIDELDSSIVPVGEVEESLGKIKRKLEILLLPYWKDRWFLYEVWTLCLPLMEAISVGAEVVLLGIKKISNENVVGTSWNLPTQKARTPVARLCGESELLVWFQRETRSRSADSKVEPDIWITTGGPDHDDLLIIECKDRFEYSNASAEKVAQKYLDGTRANTVWVVNYDDVGSSRQKTTDLVPINGRLRGIAYNFRPGWNVSGPKSSIRELFKAELCPQPIHHFLVIDISGSMADKSMPSLSDFEEGGSRRANRVYVWNDTVQEIDFRRALGARSVNDLNVSGAENATALSTFVASLEPAATLTIVTDNKGYQGLSAVSIHDIANGISKIEGHVVDFIIV